MSDDEYEVPLLDQRYFGAGIKRQRIKFVPASKTPANTALQPEERTGLSAADKYLAITLGLQRSDSGVSTKPEQEETSISRTQDTNRETFSEHDSHEVGMICTICQKPLAGNDDTRKEHDRSLVHQICLQHSYPPSHIDRKRKGLAVLQSQGWQPDSRLGLGAAGEGILYPVKATKNPEKVGLGAALAEVHAKAKPVKLDAGKVRKQQQTTRRQTDKLRDMFYRSEEIDRYLGNE